MVTYCTLQNTKWFHQHVQIHHSDLLQTSLHSKGMSSCFLTYRIHLSIYHTKYVLCTTQLNLRMFLNCYQDKVLLTRFHHSTNSPNPNVLTNHFRETGMSPSLSGHLADEGTVQRLCLFRLSLQRFCSVLIQSLEAILLQDVFQVVREIVAFKYTIATSVMLFFCFSHGAVNSFTVDYFKTLKSHSTLDTWYLCCLVVLF